MIKLNKKRNPIITDYGYHATNSDNMKSIIKLGLIPGFSEKKYTDHDLAKISSYFYNNKQPLYFADLPDIERIPETLVHHFKKKRYDIWLKIDVSSLNQLPDLLMLVLDFRFHTFNNVLSAPDLFYKNNKSLTKVLKKYDYDIPFDKLKTDDDLITELILLTGTFVVNRKISSSYIKDTIPINYENT